jgi:uncharacterized membrane protein YoaT (DUF817 family)
MHVHFTKGKVLSLLVGLGYIVAIIVHEHGVTGSIFKCFAGLVLPLVFIWFPDKLGNYLGFWGAGNYIDSVTPPTLVSFIGWFFLVGFPLLFYLAVTYG